MTGPHVLEPADWRPLAAAHRARAEGFTADHLARRRRGKKHPIEDFLFDYYGFRPARLARWHPGPGVGLREAFERADWPFYRVEADVARLDVAAFRAARARGIDWARRVLAGTESREPFFGCFGLHEWAMVYRLPADQVRHQLLPLRVTAGQVAAVVESHEIRCSHYDAFRFFTPDARPRNALQPAPETQPDLEQPGCLHGGVMDLYRWAFKLDPAVPGDLLLDAFELARRARLLDMRSSPYDLRPLGFTNIAIETPEGKAEHVREQRALAAAARPLRRRLLGVLAELGAMNEPTPVGRRPLSAVG